jgi:hypothetical protein
MDAQANAFLTVQDLLGMPGVATKTGKTSDMPIKQTKWMRFFLIVKPHQCSHTNYNMLCGIL